VANVLVVAALQLGDPILLIVQVKADDALIHLPGFIAMVQAH
jgi:hypothetical protein